MSRVGKQPVPIPEGIKVNILADHIEVEGPKGKLTSPLFPGIFVEMEDNHMVFTRASDSPQHRSMHGLCRTLAHNAVVGVSAGFTKALEIVGVGYRAKLDKNRLELSLGYSKPVIYEIPEDIEIVLERPTLISVKGIDKQRVGQEAHKIRSFRKPDPYKLKGIRYVGERLIKKERKAGVVGV
ncbi:MAG: 50S ribosomal protein L6 [Candidatus Aminicenantes bacterium]|nr:MAG: 50S ribosomal protein L6 [Candidatus Aminicenantes bacterium]